MGITSTSPPFPPTKARPRREAATPLVPEEAAAFDEPSDKRRAVRQRSKRAALILRVLAPVLLGIALVAAWQIVVQMGRVSEFVLPAPADVAQSFWGSLQSGSLLQYTRVTALESLLGCALGALVALPLGYSIAHSRFVASTVQPYLAASQAVPAVAIAPLIGLWLGYGLTPVVALCALIVFFPMVITTVLGLRMLDQDILDAARVEGAGRWALLWHIEFPLALPSILAGLRTSLTLSITGSVVGEFVVGGNGLGELLIVERSFADAAGVFVTLFMLALLAAVLYGGVRLIERRLL
ncbi:MAG TPA: ABC transporter permease subunit [Ktedonobacterales bacterium]